MVDTKSAEVAISVELPVNLPLPVPVGANYFHFTVVAGEVQMLVGSVNLLRVHEARLQGEAATIIPEISHRFTLSAWGFTTLNNQLAKIAESLASGRGNK